MGMVYLFTTIDLKTDNLDGVSIPRKIVATFDVEHQIHGTTFCRYRNSIQVIYFQINDYHHIEISSF